MNKYPGYPRDWAVRVKIFDKICKILKIKVGSIEPYEYSNKNYSPSQRPNESSSSVS